MYKLQALSVLLVVSVCITSCLNFEEECEVTSEPLSQDNLRTADTVVFGRKSTSELYYIVGDCGIPKFKWSYSGNANYNSDGNSINSFQYFTSGTQCAYAYIDDNQSKEICQEVTVLRNGVWGILPDHFPEEATRQAITMSINETIYSGFGYENNWYMFDTTSLQWIGKSSIPNLVDFTAFAGFVIDNKAYVLGNNSKLYVYDPDADQWTFKSNFPESFSVTTRFSSTSVKNGFLFPVLSDATNGKAYIGIGAGSELWEYDPVQNSWTQLPNMPIQGKIGDHTFAYKDRVYVGSYYFDITANEWKRNGVIFNKDYYSPGFVKIGDLMYSGKNGRLISYDGVTINFVNEEESEYTIVPYGYHGEGAVGGNFVIYRGLMGYGLSRDVHYYIIK